MSLNSSPGRKLADAFDGYYDSEYTSSISSKMYVPDKISAIEGLDTSNMISAPQQNAQRYMHVPERILVAGDNQHISGREQLPELRIESSFHMNQPSCVLETPPNVLTVDEFPYPVVDLAAQPKKQQMKPLSQPENGLPDLNESSMSAVGAPEEEVLILRRQVRHLSRRVLAIEQESQQRQQREMILYTIGVIYLTFKSLSWLHRHF